RDDTAGTKPGQLLLSDLHPWKDALVEIPYTVEQSTPDISMRLEIRYETAKGSFSYLKSIMLRHELPLDVDVDDVFHLDRLLSSFTIRTAAALPLMITETCLSESSVYNVEAPHMEDRMTVDAYTPVRLSYKITRKPNVSALVKRREAALALTLRYISTAELVSGTMQERFAVALGQGQYSALSRLLIPAFRERARVAIIGPSLDVAAMMGHVKLPSFETFGWQAVVATLPPAAQSGLVEWLCSWHEEHSRLELSFAGKIAQSVSSSITISVEVPTVDMVFNASLTLRLDASHQPPGPMVLTLGKPVRAQLVVQAIDAWSAHALFPQGKGRDAARDRFVLEVQSDQDTWLVGGPRRVQFTAEADEAITHEITLVPLRLGALRLPVIDIQPKPEVLEEGKSKPSPPTPVSCETNYESGSRIIEVVRDIRTTRMHITDAIASNEDPASLLGHGAEHG
ncbi:hypothetical protein LTR53_013663, partial [Teratosphaeriaceae sp. CCFEE 6253]